MLIYRPYKETANAFLVTASISPAVWELHALSPPSAGRYAFGTSASYDEPTESEGPGSEAD